MKIRILTIGKLKEKYLVNGINEYVKRLNAYCKVEMVEVPDEPIPDNASENVENIIKDKEGRWTPNLKQIKLLLKLKMMNMLLF